ncbi:hypothetical protein SAMN04487948_101333 [Halogranum amylolyticum]|uniref:PAS domain-containing protein n=1 Tax=Halogranum amylolyticum TaxID=660520 RepID=A0A1H8N5X9_9EURY|nr:bacterio-opsin activator domain-containing protein [Halogranum amylolyticum]SEO24946.1 hypothetical protein SAMN04487948_101333 [Halogranum amylolyticum]
MPSDGRSGTRGRVHEREPLSTDALAADDGDERLPYASLFVTSTGGVLTWNDDARRLLGYRSDEILGRLVSAFYTPEDVADGVPRRLLAKAEIEGHAESTRWQVRVDGSRFRAEIAVTVVVDDEELCGFTMVVAEATEGTRRRDPTRRRPRELRETTHRRERDELAADHLDCLLRGLVRQVVDLPSRDRLERTLCRRLVDSGRYRFAAVGEPTVDDREFTLRAVAGDDGVHEAMAQAATDAGFVHPAVEAFGADRCIAVSDVPTNPDIPEAVRSVAVAHDVLAVVAVPLSFGETAYGVLVVYATTPEAFGERERATFDLLGRTVGLASNAVRTRQLLFADSIVELELRSTDPSSFLVDLSSRCDCVCHLDGQVVAAEDRVVQYVRVVGVSPETALACVESHDEVEAVCLVTADETTALLAVTVAVSGSKRLLETGAYVRSAVAEDGVSTVVVDVAKGEHVRSVVDAFRSAYPESRVVGKRERDRPPQPTMEFRHRLSNRLTERQRAALEAAYLAGYFEWPRGSTAEEIAAIMGISSATLHYHLRRAQHELVEAYLDVGEP